MGTRSLLAIALGVGLALGGCTKPEAEAPAGKTTLSIAQGEDLSKKALAILGEKCTACHGAERFEARHFTAEEWSRVESELNSQYNQAIEQNKTLLKQRLGL